MGMKKLFINWVGNEDDFTLSINSTVLRAEQMDHDLWWWALIDSDTEIASGYQISESAAKRKAILRYNRYKKYGG